MYSREIIIYFLWVFRRSDNSEAENAIDNVSTGKGSKNVVRCSPKPAEFKSRSSGGLWCGAELNLMLMCLLHI